MAANKRNASIALGTVLACALLRGFIRATTPADWDRLGQTLQSSLDATVSLVGQLLIVVLVVAALIRLAHWLDARNLARWHEQGERAEAARLGLSYREYIITQTEQFMKDEMARLGLTREAYERMLLDKHNEFLIKKRQQDPRWARKHPELYTELPNDGGAAPSDASQQ